MTRSESIDPRGAECDCGMGTRSADEHYAGCPKSIGGLWERRYINWAPPTEIKPPPDDIDFTDEDDVPNQSWRVPDA